MQQLHLVGFTTDLEGLIFSARRGAKSGGFVLALDDQLLELLEEALRLRGERDGEGEDPEGEERADPRSPGHPSKGAAITPKRAPRPESGLTPREIQSRLRSGRTIDEVASEAGVDQEWIARFAPPIQAEQRQVVDRARELTFSKSRLGPSTQTLGTSVLWNLVDRGVALTEDEYENGWSAYHLRDTAWVVRFAYVSRRRTQTAEWEVDLRDAELFSLNRLASDLGYVEPGRRKRRIAFAEPPPETPSAVATSPAPARATAKKATAKKTTAKKTGAKRATAKKTTAKKAAAKKTAAKKTAAKKTAKKAATKRAPVKKAPVRKKAPAPKRAPATKRAPAKKAAAKNKAATARKATPTRASARRSARPARTPGKKATARKAPRRAPTAQVTARPAATPPVVARAVVTPVPVSPRRPPIIPVATAPAPPPGGRRPQPVVAEPVRRVPPHPAAALVTASDTEQAPEPIPTVRVVPRPSRADEPPTEIVRIDTRSPAVIASADRRSPEQAAEPATASPATRTRTRVRPLRANPAVDVAPDGRGVDPSPQPRPPQPAVRIRAGQADQAGPSPSGAVRAVPEGRPRRRPLRAR